MSKHKKQKREVTLSDTNDLLPEALETFDAEVTEGAVTSPVISEVPKEVPAPEEKPVVSEVAPPTSQAAFAVREAKRSPQVEVIPRVDVPRVSIGGKLYSFRKGVAQFVPEDVKQRLRECEAL